MIKTDTPIMQTLYQEDEVEVSSERRASLAYKGQRLYGKYCGTKGRGICAESFAEYHIWRGEYAVVRDFLVFLDGQLDQLHQSASTSPAISAQLEMTERLVGRIRYHLGEMDSNVIPAAAE
jgi:hypothetical protein